MTYPGYDGRGGQGRAGAAEPGERDRAAVQVVHLRTPSRARTQT